MIRFASCLYIGLYYEEISRIYWARTRQQTHVSTYYLSNWLRSDGIEWCQILFVLQYSGQGFRDLLSPLFWLDIHLQGKPFRLFTLTLPVIVNCSDCYSKGCSSHIGWREWSTNWSWAWRRTGWLLAYVCRKVSLFNRWTASAFTTDPWASQGSPCFNYSATKYLKFAVIHVSPGCSC